MSPTLIAVTGGATAGFGVWLLLRLAVPHHPDLAAVFTPPVTPVALTTISHPTIGENGSPTGNGVRRWLAGRQLRLEAALARTGLKTPDGDLAVVELGRGQFLLIRVGAVFAGLLAAPLYVVLFAAFGTGIPMVVPAAAGLLLGAAGWVLPGVVVAGKADLRRREMRYALVSYFTLLALHRAAGEGMAAALDEAAASSEGWTFRRIRDRIDSAMRTGRAPWDGLAELGADLGIEELADLASIADVAATGGAGVYSTLLARARALRHELQTREEADAAIQSARLVIPKAMLGIVTLLFLLYPAVTAIGT